SERMGTVCCAELLTRGTAAAASTATRAAKTRANTRMMCLLAVGLTTGRADERPFEIRRVAVAVREIDGAVGAETCDDAIERNLDAVDDLARAIHDVVGESVLRVVRGGRQNPQMVVKIGEHRAAFHGRVVVRPLGVWYHLDHVLDFGRSRLLCHGLALLREL